MKALVTGGGFLGQAIAAMLLGRGDVVRIFSRQRHPEIEMLGAEGVQGDVRDLDALVRACMGREAVFHTAALSRGAWNAAALCAAVNVAGTQHVLEACKRRGVEKFLFAGAASPHRSFPQVVPNPFYGSARVPGFEFEWFLLHDATGRAVGSCPGGQVGVGLPPGVYFLQSLRHPKAGTERLVKLQ